MNGLKITLSTGGSMRVELNWVTDLAFEVKNENGLRYFVDSLLDDGSPGLGPKPMEMVLAALAGCTGMDVVSILKKMRVQLNSFNMSVEGERADEHPKVFTSVTLAYHFDCPEGTDTGKILKAVNLSQEKYCSVGAMIKKAVDYRYRVFVNGNLIFDSNQP